MDAGNKLKRLCFVLGLQARFALFAARYWSTRELNSVWKEVVTPASNSMVCMPRISVAWTDFFISSLEVWEESICHTQNVATCSDDVIVGQIIEIVRIF